MMNLDRKKFLQLMITGGLGAVFGGTIPPHWTSRGTRLRSVRRQSVAMGSVISFDVVAETEKAGYDAIRKAMDTFRKMDKIFSMYDEGSEMAELAKTAGKRPVPVSDEAIRLFTFAKKMYTDSGHRFDMTIEPAMRRWGFRQNPGKSLTPPTDQERRKIERLIGMDKVNIENDKIGLTRNGMAIDTGGIAGGFALDKAVEIMKECDVAAGFINFSGDIHCFGQPLDGQYWPVYIWDPVTQQPLADPVALKNEALSTSGAYQNRRHDKAHDSWGHLLLPSKAEPIEPLSSVTAVHPSAMVADAWSTAAYLGSVPPDDVSITTIPK